MLARRTPPAQIRVAPLKPTVIENEEHRRRLVEQCTRAADWLKARAVCHRPNAWVIDDIPKRDVIFTKSLELLKKDKGQPVMSRDSVKVLTHHGELRLLIDVSQSLMKVLEPVPQLHPAALRQPRHL